VPQVDYLLGERRGLTAADFEHKALSQDDVRRILQFVLWTFDEMRSWEKDLIHQALVRLADALGFKIRDFLFPVFVAVSGRAVALPLFDSIVMLGADLTRMRLRDALDVLGGVSKKLGKQLEKEFRSLIDTPPTDE
jgi:glutamyl-tRNA synthetase